MPQTNTDDLCLRFLNLSGEIRFAGVIDRMGGLIAGGMKEGIESLENEEESIKLYLGYAFNNAVRQDFDPTFGKVLYTVSEREKLKLATFPFGENILLVSMSKQAPHLEIIDNILHILRKYF
jgi:hypothetical protein